MYYIFCRIRSYTEIAHVMNYNYISFDIPNVQYNYTEFATFNVFAQNVTFRIIRVMSN